MTKMLILLDSDKVTKVLILLDSALRRYSGLDSALRRRYSGLDSVFQEGDDSARFRLSGKRRFCLIPH